MLMATVKQADLYQDIRDLESGMREVIQEHQDLQNTCKFLAKCLRLTQEYVGAETLPAIPGWAWYDGLEEYKRAFDTEVLP